GYEYGSFHFLEPSFLHNYTDSTFLKWTDSYISGIILINCTSISYSKRLSRSENIDNIPNFIFLRTKIQIITSHIKQKETFPW
ncbi:hypothetical protein ABNC92_20605, partial [Paenibacillus larvae]